jgi:hypothetical protein
MQVVVTYNDIELFPLLCKLLYNLVHTVVISSLMQVVVAYRVISPLMQVVVAYRVISPLTGM